MNCYGIDMCATLNGGCSVHARCAITGPGSRTCTCDANYTGNGVKCREMGNCDVVGEDDDSLNYGGCDDRTFRDYR